MAILSERDPCKGFELDKQFINNCGGWYKVEPFIQEMLQARREICQCGTNCQRRFFLLTIKGGHFVTSSQN